VTEKTVANESRPRLQFSLQDMLVLVGSVAAVLAVCVGIARYIGDAEVRTQLCEAREWRRALPLDGSGHSFPAVVDGQNFLISNKTAIYDDVTEVWAISSESRHLTRTVFVTPPGVEVDSIDEAFNVMRREVAREKQKQIAKTSAKK
jgi:hypothetical protein